MLETAAAVPISAYCLLAAVPDHRAAEAPRSNVLFRLADDLSRTLHSCSHAQVESPDIDRLAESGERERRNLAGDPARAETVVALKQQLRESARNIP